MYSLWMILTKIRVGLLILLTASIAICQQKSPSSAAIKETHGTCATTAFAPFGIAFIIDSRLTNLDAQGKLVSQDTGCKVRLARPTILLAGIGLEATSNQAGRWNSLDAAATALKQLPDNPTEDQLDQWSFNWGQTLAEHFQKAREIPSDTGTISEMLLITRVGTEFYFKRAGVVWDGHKFFGSIESQVRDKQIPQVEYAGACRAFVSHSIDQGFVPPRYSLPTPLNKRLQIWGHKKAEATTVNDLVRAVYGLETVFADNAKISDPDHPVIAPPYATAEWAVGDPGWSVNFNAECVATHGASSGQHK